MPAIKFDTKKRLFSSSNTLLERCRRLQRDMDGEFLYGAAVNLYKKKGFVFTGEDEPVEGRAIKEMVKEKKFSVRFDCGARSFYWTGQSWQKMPNCK